MTHVLLVKGQPGSANELIDRRAVFEDKVFISSTMNITFMLIDRDSSIRAAGTESATVEAHGSMKDVIELDARTVRHPQLAH